MFHFVSFVLEVVVLSPETKFLSRGVNKIVFCFEESAPFYYNSEKVRLDIHVDVT